MPRTRPRSLHAAALLAVWAVAAAAVFLPRVPGSRSGSKRPPARSRLLVSALSRSASTKAPVTLVSTPVANDGVTPVQYRFTVKGAEGAVWNSEWSVAPVASVAPATLRPGTTYDVVVETRDTPLPRAIAEARATPATSATSTPLSVPAENQPPGAAALVSPTAATALPRSEVVPLVATASPDAEGDAVEYRFTLTDAAGALAWQSQWSPYPVSAFPADGLPAGATYAVAVETRDALGAAGPASAPVAVTTTTDPPVLEPASPPAHDEADPAPPPTRDGAGATTTTVAGWADLVLVRLAARIRVPEAMVATPEHRLALVAWAKSEGGGVDAHCGRFNPLNTKKLDAELGAVKVCGFATVDYASVDAGAEAAVRTMRGRYQNRVVGALANPVTTAEQVLTTLASWDAVDAGGARLFPTNLCWACPGTHYLDNLLSTLASVRNTKAKGWYGDRVLRTTPTGR